MIGAILKLGLMLAPILLPKVLSWFGIRLNETELQAGERLGRAEVIAAGNERELQNAKEAIDAGRAADAVNAAGGLRDPHAGDRPWNPDGL